MTGFFTETSAAIVEAGKDTKTKEQMTIANFIIRLIIVFLLVNQ